MSAPLHNQNHDHITARHFHQWTGSSYPLPADAREKERLQLQHDAVKHMYEDRIILAPVEFNEEAKVLDIGTGSGTWAVELATNTPYIEITAIDIEAGCLPPVLPENVKFQLGTVLELPKKWDNRFSLVHQRCLLLGLEREKWLVALKEIYRVLQPGGWVQLGEPKLWPRDYKDYDRPCTEKLATILRAVADSKNFYADCAEDLGRMLQAVGFTNIKGEIRRQGIGAWAGEQGVAWRKNLADVFNGIETSAMDEGGFGLVNSVEEYDLLLEGFEEECDKVRGGGWEFIIYYAQKPL
ncbi:S-adenosyl-L-methionine-dependent methyltransferase [Mycena indigotica]|uniref:S-adenosyl-L-methionine-dependent methyltransferase n=1 Tax=Mycena indigotica TaxID=2126181 RepID=A0A8H6VVH9_9AGAR|nr:S-adenosyl-L-methionine-dependent methyltransferase [Mycena indigotica]KAF7295427.1 S-adenosyl-L-methionine-dependent methyltransferase [Mycena indigotica]